MSKTERISLWRSELLRQYSQKTGEPLCEPEESLLTDDLVDFAIELGLAIA